MSAGVLAKVRERLNPGPLAVVVEVLAAALAAAIGSLFAAGDAALTEIPEGRMQAAVDCGMVVAFSGTALAATAMIARAAPRSAATAGSGHDLIDEDSHVARARLDTRGSGHYQGSRDHRPDRRLRST